jgi:hypothetical protein
MNSLHKEHKMNVQWGHHVCPFLSFIFKATHKIFMEISTGGLH